MFSESILGFVIYRYGAAPTFGIWFGRHNDAGHNFASDIFRNFSRVTYPPIVWTTFGYQKSRYF